MKQIGLFLDIDGTLTNDQKKISEYDKKIITKMIEQEMAYVYLVTGKSLHNAIEYYNELGLKTKMVTSTGQVISNPSTSENIMNEFTDPDLVKKIIKDIGADGYFDNFLIEEQNGKYSVFNPKDSNLINLIAGTSSPKKHDEAKILENIIGLYVELQNIDDKKANAYAEALEKKYPQLRISCWHTADFPPILHIMPSKTSKAIAIAKIIKEDKIGTSISYGNGLTDIDMITNVDIGIAMKNAFPDVKTSADKVTEFNNNNSGVGKDLAIMFDLK